jgi:hypothetical protein
MARGQAIALAALAAAAAAGAAAPARAQESGAQLMAEARSLHDSGQFFKAARYAFAAEENDPSLQAEAYSWITVSLTEARLYNAASYFFVRTLQSGSKPAIRRALTVTEAILSHVGPDLVRKYLVRHTAYEDYDATNRSAYLYSLGKEALLRGDELKAVGYLNAMSPQSPLWPFALQLRATSLAIAGKGDDAIADFHACANAAGKLPSSFAGDARRERQAEREADDLKARCQAGVARTLYQMDKFEDADREYDRIPKSSLVWPDILFEQAWNAFGRTQYNRTLGKLVSYKSPALEFVYNSEVDVLRSQTFLMLCLFDDANQVINEFNAKYTKLGEEVKELVERDGSDLTKFYDVGKSALGVSLYSKNSIYKMANRFVRGPYFQGLVVAEDEVLGENNAVKRFAAMQPGVDNRSGHGFPGFLEQVLGWRVRTIRLLGGAFVKNSLLDYHGELIADFEKMAFIKLEMLKQAKEKLLFKHQPVAERSRGNVIPERRDYQYYWSFNGEFWNDELGDYVFGLESACGRADGG